jgi:transcriptional regulator with XRE-family HTH domain
MNTSQQKTYNSKLTKRSCITHVVTMSETTQVGTNLRKLRDERGITQARVAELAGVSSVGVLKHRDHSDPRIGTIGRIAAALNVNTELLYLDPDDRSRRSTVAQANSKP